MRRRPRWAAEVSLLFVDIRSLPPVGLAEAGPFGGSEPSIRLHLCPSRSDLLLSTAGCVLGFNAVASRSP